jgi:hypothetical protein
MWSITTHNMRLRYHKSGVKTQASIFPKMLAFIRKM